MKTLNLFTALSLLILCSCGTTQPGSVSPGVKMFPGKGVIKEIKTDGTVVVIQHEAIPGYMSAMTMPFPVKDTNELAQVKAGDAVSFRIMDNNTDAWIDQVTKISSGGTNSIAQGNVRVARFVPPLSPGDVLPSYTFTNELGKVVKLSSFKGQAYALTFIFTRCGFPLYCPRMTSNFAEVQKRMSADPKVGKNWHLITFTFDPEFDTPKTLLAYAKARDYDPKKWSFLTGSQYELDAIEDHFELRVERDGASFSHNMRTVIINARGEVQRIMKNNDWTVDEMVAELSAATRAN